MLQERGRGGCDRRKNEIGLERDEFLREPLSRLPVVGRRPARVELDVATFHPPELLKCLAECGEERWPFQVVLGVAHQHTDPPHSVRLRTRGKRPRSRRARNNFYEISPPHVLPPRIRTEVSYRFAPEPAHKITVKQSSDVRFGSKTDMCGAQGHVCFTPKADMCSATASEPQQAE